MPAARVQEWKKDSEKEQGKANGDRSERMDGVRRRSSGEVKEKAKSQALRQAERKKFITKRQVHQKQGERAS